MNGKMKAFTKFLLAGVAAGILFGFALPALVSAKSTLMVVLGVVLALAIIWFIGWVCFSYNTVEKVNELHTDNLSLPETPQCSGRPLQEGDRYTYPVGRNHPPSFDRPPPPPNPPSCGC